MLSSYLYTSISKAIPIKVNMIKIKQRLIIKFQMKAIYFSPYIMKISLFPTKFPQIIPPIQTLLSRSPIKKQKSPQLSHL